MRRTERFLGRQGDVLVLALVATAVAVDGLTKIAPEAGRTILAHGEVTGHAHALPADVADLYGPSDDLQQLLGPRAAARPGDRLLVVRGDTQLTHEEHAPVGLRAGLYLVRRQREYSPEEVRQVAD